MTIPDTAYETGIWDVHVQEQYDAQALVRDYHATRSVCLAKQKRLPLYRIAFLAVLGVLCVNYITEFTQPDLNNFMAILCSVYAVLTLYFVLVRRNLSVPAWGSLAFLLEVFRLEEWTALMPMPLVPMLLLGAAAYGYGKDKRYIEHQPGYPEFHDIEVRVIETNALTKREIPAPAEPVDDPYSDVLSSLQ